jgi:histidine triad (HIT) family protein
MSDCIFCDIASGKIPAKVAHRDAEIVAFHDVSPKAPTHFLVVPVRHLESVREAAEADAALLGRMLLVCKDLAAREGIDRAGYRIVTNSGPAAGQSVFHLHFHVLGGREMGWPPG